MGWSSRFGSKVGVEAGEAVGVPFVCDSDDAPAVVGRNKPDTRKSRKPITIKMMARCSIRLFLFEKERSVMALSRDYFSMTNARCESEEYPKNVIPIFRFKSFSCDTILV